jgi:CRAL/TRIO domain
MCSVCVLQEAHPVRLKKIYIVHSQWFVNQAFAIVKPFIKTELMSLLHFTTGGPDEIFPPEILPEVNGKEKKSETCTEAR